jgi:Tfp pilus assembly protein PilV
MNLTSKRCFRRRGFALIEAAIALLIVALGLLTVGATFLKLSRSEDLARQTGEATRLVQERIETMRSYTRITDAGGVVSWNGLASGTDTITGNVDYTRSWTLGGSSGDTMRPLVVAVSWVDRSNEAQSVSMSTVISRIDPADVGSLGFPLPANTTLKRPKNRSLNIPVPSSDLGNGESAFRFPNTNSAAVFSNETGYVVKLCSLAAGVSTITLGDLGACSNTNAYILAGFIAVDAGSTFPAGLSINANGIIGDEATTCSVSAAIELSNNPSIAGYRYYLCVISVATSGATWSGTTLVAAPALSAGSDVLICRFQFPAASGISSNQRNVQPYVGVAESLDNQNYLITGNASCPTINNLSTTQHQRCISSNANRTVDCPPT